MINDKKILITGGLGFIGFNAALRFSKNNKVCVVDDCSRVGVECNIKHLKDSTIDFHQVDISHFKQLRDVFYSFEPDVVMHMAAQVAVTLSITNPLRDYNTNMQGSFNLLELARASHNKPIMLYASTNKVYGSSSQDVVIENGRWTARGGAAYSEKTQLSFEAPYGCSKGAADQYFIDYARTYDLPTVVFRQSCIYGPHQYGMEDQGWVAWFAICSVFSKPVTIYGDGNQVRDVLYVDDLIDLYEKAVIKIDKVKGEAFNVGGGPTNTLSLNELINILNRETRGNLKVSFSDWRLGDQKVYISDISKAKRLLNWEPIITPADGIRKLLSWIKEERARITYVHEKHGEEDRKYDVSIVIPAKNEEASLPSVCDELNLMMQGSPYRFEVILVNDRSTDRTIEVAKNYPFVKIINSKYKPGKGGALRSGFDEAKGTYIAMMDGDFSHDALDLPLLIDEARRHKGLVVASRVTGGSEEYTRIRAFGNVFLTWFFGFLHGRYLSDILNGFKVFHRDIYFEFKYSSTGFEIEIELLANTAKLKRTISELPSRERSRLGGKMKSSVIRHGWRFFWQILLEYFRKRGQ